MELDHHSFIDIEEKIIQSLKKYYDSIQISTYREYSHDNDMICTTNNIVFVPSYFQSAFEQKSKFDFCAFRFQIKRNNNVVRSITLSCFSSRSIDDSSLQNDTPFNNENINEIWNNTRDVYRHSIYYIDDLTRWYNYLVSIDTLSFIYPKLLKVLSDVGLSDNLIIDEASIYNLLANRNAKYVADRILNIFDGKYSSDLSHYTDESIHRASISKHSFTLMNLERLNTISKTRCLSTDEFVGAVFCNMKAAYIGEYSYVENSIQDIGETYQSLYRSSFFSKINKTNFESELIASLWKSVDDKSIYISYQKTPWNNKNYYRLYFRFGERPTCTIRLSALAAAIIDCWQTVTNEDSIEITNLDQLLSLTSVFKSSLCLDCCQPLQVVHMDSLTDPACTLVYLGNNSYIAATNYLLRSKILKLKNEKDKRVIIDDNIISSSICSSNTFKQCRNDLPLLIRYFYHFGDKYNPILNKVFPKDEKTIKNDFHGWTNDAVDFMSMSISLDKNVEQANRLSMIIERLLAFSFQPMKDDLRNEMYHSDLNIAFIDKITVPSDKINYDLYLKLFSCMSFWELYCQIFVYKDYPLADMIFDKLVEIHELNYYDDIVNVWHRNKSIDSIAPSDKAKIITSISNHLKTLDSNVL